jgi:type II secretory ATPase GspE/PulE/Tfp pilus assembly ATPase PilB-like protein
MSPVSLKHLLAMAQLATPEQFEAWQKAWRVAAANGSQESLLEFIRRESSVSEETFLQRLALVLNWPFLDLRRVTVPTEARNKLSTKVAFQYNALPTDVQDSTLQVAVSNPFDAGMLSAVQFDARMPVQFALAPKPEIEKALKKYYGVGAETLDTLAKDEPIDLLVEDKEITESDQEASVIKFVNQIVWEAYKDRATDIHFEPAEDELRIRYRIDGVSRSCPE